MKYFKANELPVILDTKTIEILTEMAMEFPKQTIDWAEVSEILKERNQLQIILDKVEIIKQQIKQNKIASMTDKEKREDAEKWKYLLENKDPNQFNGNMGQPETPQDYKNRYGKYPDGYDSNGNKK